MFDTCSIKDQSTTGGVAIFPSQVEVRQIDHALASE